MYVYLFTYLFSVILNWVCWVRGNFSGGPGHIYSVCVTPLCGVPGRYNFIWCFHGADGGTVQIFLVSWLCSGYGTVEMVKGVVRFSAFFSFLSVLRQEFFVLYVSIFFGRFMVLSRDFLFCKLLIFNNLLQVVPAQSELGGGPGTSA